MARFEKLFFRFAVHKGQVEIDKETGDALVRRVSVMTEGQAETHFVKDGDRLLPVFMDAETLASVKDAAAKYANGVKVKADHSGGIRSITGHLFNFIQEGKQLFADFRIFKEALGFEHLMKLIATIPDTFGFSATMSGPMRRAGDKVLARCDELLSIDLVTDPSTNPAGLFEVKVDKGENGDDMTPDEIKSACEAALKPHIDGIHTRLAAMEAAHNAMKTKMDATTGAPSAPQDEDGLYARFEKRIEGKVTSMVDQAAQAAATTLQKLGLQLGKGPTPNPGEGSAKKVEDMTFMEVVEMEFSKPENAGITDFEIVRKVTFAHKDKHAAAMKANGLGTLPPRRVPYRKAS